MRPEFDELKSQWAKHFSSFFSNYNPTIRGFPFYLTLPVYKLTSHIRLHTSKNCYLWISASVFLPFHLFIFRVSSTSAIFPSVRCLCCQLKIVAEFNRQNECKWLECKWLQYAKNQTLYVTRCDIDFLIHHVIVKIVSSTTKFKPGMLNVILCYAAKWQRKMWSTTLFENTNKKWVGLSDILFAICPCITFWMLKQEIDNWIIQHNLHNNIIKW